MSVLIDTGRLDLGSARRALQASLTGATGAHTYGCSATRKTCLRDSSTGSSTPM
jgi:hypothetical protein